MILQIEPIEDADRRGSEIACESMIIQKRITNMKTETVPIDDLTPDPANARKHNERNLSAVIDSLRAFGQQKPIVVDRRGVVVAGNGTIEAAKRLGWKEISIVRTELDATQATAFGIADNRTAELAEWDDEILHSLLDSMDKETRGRDPGKGRAGHEAGRPLDARSSSPALRGCDEG